MALPTRAPTGFLGAGAVLFLPDAAGVARVLLVRMNYGAHRGSWILPGGAVDDGEHPSGAALRELREETGVSGASVRRVLAVRHRVLKRREGMSARSDTYWVFEVRHSARAVEELSLAWPADEILEARFWPVDEALASPEVRPLTRGFVRMALGSAPGLVVSELPDGHPEEDEVFGV